ncbi:hypothetical protein [Clostridium sp.]|uniref:hypothetical protein n=1 Tax=Clostridium sp. TaxID=1506 RepID=UPI002FC6C288
MSNHFEFNNDGFDNLLDVTEGTTLASTEPVVEETPAGESLLASPSTEINTDPRTRSESKQESESDTGDFLKSFLNEYGLKDGKVTYETEDGGTEEVDFNSLDSDEKLNILKELATPNLSKDEVEVVNYLRSNNATFQDVVTYYSKKAVDDYIKENGPIEKQYSVDEYSNDELYVADLKEKFSDMTDAEIKTDLENAKENSELFNKKVDILRKQYKSKEEDIIAEKEREREDQFTSFKNALEGQLTEFNAISMDYKDSKSDSLQIEDSEKEEIYNYVLNQDENGATQFFKDLNDPKRLVELAWFALYGKDAVSDISNYWKSQLKTTRSTESKPQTTIVTSDGKIREDNFSNHRKSVETKYGEDLL